MRTRSSDPELRARCPRPIVPLLDDAVRAIRIEAARALAGTDLLALTPQQPTAFVKTTAVLVAAEQVDTDRSEAHLNLGLLEMRRGDRSKANTEYRTALRLDPAFVPAMVNLADLDLARGKDEQGAELLRKAMSIEPNNADVLHSFGLFLVRRHDYAGALDLLRPTHELAPDNARYAYVYGVALNSTGAHADAMALLEKAHQRHPSDRNILLALVSIARDNGDLVHARELVSLDPSDTQLRSRPGARKAPIANAPSTPAN